MDLTIGSIHFIYAMMKLITSILPTGGCTLIISYYDFEPFTNDPFYMKDVYNFCSL